MCAAHWPAVRALAAACDLPSIAGVPGCSKLAISLAACMAVGPPSLVADAELQQMFVSLLGRIPKVSSGLLGHTFGLLLPCCCRRQLNPQLCCWAHLLHALTGALNMGPEGPHTTLSLPAGTTRMLRAVALRALVSLHHGVHDGRERSALCGAAGDDRAAATDGGGGGGQRSQHQGCDASSGEDTVPALPLVWRFVLLPLQRLSACAR